MSQPRPTAALAAALVSALTVLRGRAADARDRGDVPGWVMITVMTAALVVAILIPFRTAIVNAVSTALTSVTGSAGAGGGGGG